MGNAKKRERKRKERRYTYFIVGFLSLFFCLSIFFELWIRSARVSNALTPVSANEVCMLDDVYTPKNNYPTIVNEITYYCCEKDCSEYITKPKFSIYAIDPVSNVQLNKASAVYGRAVNGRVYYFDSLENLYQYSH